MEDNKLPPVEPTSPQVESDTLEYAEESKSVASFSGAQKRYPLETLEVHSEGSNSARAAVFEPTMLSVPFSRRRAMVVSLIITLVVVVLTGVVAGLFVSNEEKTPDKSRLNVATQDVPLEGSIGVTIPELQGTEDGLLVNGDIITRGELKVFCWRIHVRYQGLIN